LNLLVRLTAKKSCESKGHAGQDFLWGVLVLMVLLTIPARAAEGQAPPDAPSEYRMENYRAPVPAVLAGVRTVSADEAHQIWRAGGTVFIDVMPRAPRPAGLPADVVWHEKVRRNIPGSTWLPDTGYGRLSEETDSYFRRNLERLTGGDRSMPVLIYCLANCWMSWNAAKRAHEAYGYTNVIWYRDGTDAWEFQGYPLEASQRAP
jgi:PQQ-dependent catabolism-associated CXXCW motif protein